MSKDYSADQLVARVFLITIAGTVAAIAGMIFAGL